MAQLKKTKRKSKHTKPSAETAHETSEEQTAPRRRKSIGMLVVGLVLLLTYVATAHVFDNFQLPSTRYYQSYNLTPIQGNRGGWPAADFAVHRMVSWATKTALLFPALVLIGLSIARTMSKNATSRLRRTLASLKPTRTVIAIVVVTSLSAFLWSHFVLNEQALYDDEYAYRFQAETFLNGWLYAPAPPSAEAFNNVFVLVQDGKWFGRYPPGHPVILAASMAMGSPYLLPVLLSGLALIFVFLGVRDQFGERTAMLTTALFAVCPLYLFANATLMSHGTTFFFLALFAFAYLRSESPRAWCYPIIAGISLGAAFAIRPQSAVAFGLPFAIRSLVLLFKPTRRTILSRHIAMFLAFAPFVFAVLSYNRHISGNYFVFPFDLVPNEVAYGLPENGISADWFLSTVFHVFINFWRVNYYLLGWGLSIAFVVIYFVIQGGDARDRLWLGVILSNAAVFSLFPVPGVLEVGPRYFFPMLLPLLLFTARGMLAADRWLRSGSPVPSSFRRAAVPVVVLSLTVGALATFYRERGVHYARIAEKVREPYRLIEEKDIHGAIINVEKLPQAGWVFGLRSNHPVIDENDNLLILKAKAADLRSLWDAFPDKKMYRLRYPFHKDDRIDPIFEELSREDLIAESKRKS